MGKEQSEAVRLGPTPKVGLDSLGLTTGCWRNLRNCPSRLSFRVEARRGPGGEGGVKGRGSPKKKWGDKLLTRKGSGP